MSEYVVVFATDENYWEVLFVALFSLIENNKDLNLKIFILSNGRNCEFDRRSSVLMKNYKNVRISNVILNAFRFEGLPTGFHFTTGIYYRLSMARVLPERVETLLYLDCDIIVRKSIRELLSTRLGDAAIGAVTDPINKQFARLNMPRGSCYFNGGVMLVNVEKWRSENVEAEIRSYLKNNAERILWPEQDALNAVLYNRCLPLSPIYNFSGAYSKLQTHGLINIDPAIAHFTGSTKPWHLRCTHLYKHEYETYCIAAQRAIVPFGE
jgi:lipopolysaccharide biosynthesis glycosyltransferase